VTRHFSSLLRDRRYVLLQELADVLMLLVQFTNVAGIDLMAAAEAKIALNETRYPIDKCKGVATKYDKL